MTVSFLVSTEAGFYLQKATRKNIFCYPVMGNLERLWLAYRQLIRKSAFTFQNAWGQWNHRAWQQFKLSEMSYNRTVCKMTIVPWSDESRKIFSLKCGKFRQNGSPTNLVQKLTMASCYPKTIFSNLAIHYLFLLQLFSFTTTRERWVSGEDKQT